MPTNDSSNCKKDASIPRMPHYAVRTGRNQFMIAPYAHFECEEASECAIATVSDKSTQAGQKGTEQEER